MRLYDDPRSGNGYKVRLLLAQLRIPYDYLPVDILKGETRTPEFLKMNGNGRIPVLEFDDGTRLAESNAILYLLSQNTRFWPDAALEQARALQWMFFEQYSHEPNIATARFWLTIKKPEPTAFNQALLMQKQEQGRAALGVMEKHLQQHPWFAGGHYGIADMALYAYTHNADEGGFDLTQYPAINDWLARVRGESDHVTIHQWKAA